jgi:hypothetical protein
VPVALRALVPEKARGWVWRCHIDLSTPDPATIPELLPSMCDLPETPLPTGRRATRRVELRDHLNIFSELPGAAEGTA